MDLPTAKLWMLDAVACVLFFAALLALLVL
jgi:hypothetical protein